MLQMSTSEWPTTASVLSIATAKTTRGYLRKVFVLYSGMHAPCSVVSLKTHSPQYFLTFVSKLEQVKTLPVLDVARGREGDGSSLLSLSRDTTGRRELGVWETQGWRHSPSLTKISLQGYGNYRFTQRSRVGRGITHIFTCSKSTQLPAGTYHSYKAQISSPVASSLRWASFPSLPAHFYLLSLAHHSRTPFQEEDPHEPHRIPNITQCPRRKEGFSGLLHPLCFPAASWGGFLPSW